MASVIDYIECPNCGNKDCYQDFNYRINEIFIVCDDCGYYKFEGWEREDGELKLKDPSKPSTYDNLTRTVEEIREPFGAFKIEYKDAPGNSGGTVYGEKHYDALKKEEWGEDIKKVTISRFIDGEVKKEIIWES